MRSYAKTAFSQMNIDNRDVENAWSKIKGSLHGLTAKHIQQNTYSIGGKRKRKPLWMNDRALASVRKKLAAYRRYIFC
jgi:hypothetical protein